MLFKNQKNAIMKVIITIIEVSSNKTLFES